MKRFLISILLLVLAVTLFSACGGGGGGGGQRGPTSAVLTLSTQGTPTSLIGIGVTVVLPSGVTVKTDSGGNVDSSVVTASGVTAGQATILAVYTAATSTPASLSLVISSTTTSFTVGQFATVHCDVQSGSPKASDFTLTGFDPLDLHANTISGLTATFSVSIQ